MYKFFVHRRHPSYRLVTSADAPLPAGAAEPDWRHTRSREAGDVNTDVREAVDRDGYALFRIGLSLSDLPKAQARTSIPDQHAHHLFLAK
ncbi:MAG TPA: hypothetical protein VGM09_11520 [Bradyrhizobium sp.]